MSKTLKHHLNRHTLFQYILPLTCFAFALLTQQFHVVTDGGYDRMYGFPFPFITGTWVTTFHHSVYIVPALVDFFLYLLVVIGLTVSLQSMGVVLKTHWFPTILIWIAVGTLYTLQFFLFADYNSYNLLYDIDFTAADTEFHAGPYPG
jgi:hypothetical protein